MKEEQHLNIMRMSGDRWREKPSKYIGNLPLIFFILVIVNDDTDTDDTKDDIEPFSSVVIIDPPSAKAKKFSSHTFWW